MEGVQNAARPRQVRPLPWELVSSRVHPASPPTAHMRSYRVALSHLWPFPLQAISKSHQLQDANSAQNTEGSGAVKHAKRATAIGGGSE